MSNAMMTAGGGKDRGQYQYAGGIGGGNDGTQYVAFNAIPEGEYRSKGAAWAPEIRIAASDVVNYVFTNYKPNLATLMSANNTHTTSSSNSGIAANTWGNYATAPANGVYLAVYYWLWITVTAQNPTITLEVNGSNVPFTTIFSNSDPNLGGARVVISKPIYLASGQKARGKSSIFGNISQTRLIRIA